MNEATPIGAKFKSQIEQSSGDGGAERRLLRGMPVIGGGHGHGRRRRVTRVASGLRPRERRAPALPLHSAGKYVAGAYIVFVALILIYVAIMARRLTRTQRDLAELQREVEATQAQEDPEHDLTGAGRN